MMSDFLKSINPTSGFSFDYTRILAHLLKHFYWIEHFSPNPGNISISCPYMGCMSLNYGIKMSLLAADKSNRVDDHLVSPLCRYYCCCGAPQTFSHFFLFEAKSELQNKDAFLI